MSEERSQKGKKPKRSLDDLPRPPTPPNWDDLPGIRKRPSLAPPAPPPSHAPPAPNTHELFDVDSAEVEHQREAVARRASERASARPHPPRRSVTPEPPRAEPLPRLSTPLSWQAMPELQGARLADAVEEEISDEFLEPATDSAPLVLPPLPITEPLASVLPTEALVHSTPAATKRRSPLAAIAAGVLAVTGVGWFVAASSAHVAPVKSAAPVRTEVAASLPAPAIETKQAPRVPLPPLELDIGVPAPPPSASVEPAKVDPASVPPVAPSGVLPKLPPKPQEPVAPPFDSAAATAALGAAAKTASTCRKEGDPVGSATVIVRYAPSGRVTSAVVESGPFAGTPAGGCIATTFRKTRVPAFSGDYVSVKKTISLR